MGVINPGGLAQQYASLTQQNPSFFGQVPEGNIPSMGSLYSGVMTELQGYGNAQQAALQQNYKNAMGQAMQSLASSGLAGTTIAPSMRMGYMKQYQLALNNLNDQLTQMKVGYQTQLGTQANQQAIQQQEFQQGQALQYAALARGAGGGGGAYGGGSGPGNQQSGRVGTIKGGGGGGYGATGDVVGDIGAISESAFPIGGGGAGYYSDPAADSNYGNPSGGGFQGDPFGSITPTSYDYGSPAASPDYGPASATPAIDPSAPEDYSEQYA